MLRLAITSWRLHAAQVQACVGGGIPSTAPTPASLSAAATGFATSTVVVGMGGESTSPAEAHRSKHHRTTNGVARWHRRQCGGNRRG
jgi:hypothetical protein